MEKPKAKAFGVKTVKGNVRLRSMQTSCLCQVLEALSFFPSAQRCSGGSAPAYCSRENINKIKRIQEISYTLLCVLLVKLCWRGGADCHCS